MSHAADPVDRMHQAVLAAGGCVNLPRAHFSAQWRVTLPDGAEAHFADTTGKRLIMRGLIGQDRTEQPDAHLVRFVPVAMPVAKPAVVKRARPKAAKPIDNALAARRAHVTPTREYKVWRSSNDNMTPWGVVDLGPPPCRSAILDRLEQIDLVVSRIVVRRASVPVELRAEIMTDIYEPLLRILLQCKRRGQKTNWNKPRKQAAAAGTHPGGAMVTTQPHTAPAR
jgi:hypothetical protein